jgi:hypothetical protein
LVSDPRQGQGIQAVFCKDFDWSANMPKGKPLGDKAVMKLQSTGQVWFVASYQCHGEAAALAVVEEYSGHDRKKLVEFGTEVQPVAAADGFAAR